MKTNKIIAIVFSVVILALPIFTSFAPKSSFSESENRPLATMPSFSIDSIFDKSWMNGIDTYISDHFIGRDFWVNVKSKTELATMKKENNSILLTDKGTLVEDLKKPDEKKLGQNINGILTFVENNSNAKVYAAIAPTSCDIYSDSLPYGKKVFSQRQTINSFYNSLNGVYGIDLYSTLYENKNEYIYYSTDHHWTSLGAFYAYKEIANALEIESYDLNNFEVESASKEFLGTYSSKSKIDVAADTIDIYTLKNYKNNISEVIVNDGKKETVYSDIYFRDWLSKKDKYSVFLGQVQPKVTVKTNVDNGKKLLMFKDSFSHSLVPFLSLHYSEIELIDLRYTNQNYRDLVNVSEYDDILLLYNIESVISASDIAALGD